LTASQKTRSSRPRRGITKSFSVGKEGGRKNVRSSKKKEDGLHARKRAQNFQHTLASTVKASRGKPRNARVLYGGGGKKQSKGEEKRPSREKRSRRSGSRVKRSSCPSCLKLRRDREWEREKGVCRPGRSGPRTAQLKSQGEKGGRKKPGGSITERKRNRFGRHCSYYGEGNRRSYVKGGLLEGNYRGGTRKWPQTGQKG